MEYFKWANVTIKCVKNECNGTVEATVMYAEGNFEGECCKCGTRVGFHCSVEVDGVYDNTDYEI